MTRRTSEHPKPTEQVATRVSADTYEALREAAEREHRSIAAQARLILERELGTHLRPVA